MVLIRSAIAGDTDYTGTKLADVQKNLSDWKTDAEDTIDELYGLRNQVNENSNQVDRYADVVDFIHLIVEELEKFLVDFDRLLKELPISVETRHPELVKQLARRNRELEWVCLDFKNEHINRRLKDENLRFLLDQIYKQSRSQLLDFRDLSNLAERLNTYIETREVAGPLSVEDIDVFELKPNFCGVGINLNHLIKRVFQLWRARSLSKRQNREAIRS